MENNWFLFLTSMCSLLIGSGLSFIIQKSTANKNRKWQLEDQEKARLWSLEDKALADKKNLLIGRLDQTEGLLNQVFISIEQIQDDAAKFANHEVTPQEISAKVFSTINTFLNIHAMVLIQNDRVLEKALDELRNKFSAFSGSIYSLFAAKKEDDIPPIMNEIGHHFSELQKSYVDSLKRIDDLKLGILNNKE